MANFWNFTTISLHRGFSLATILKLIIKLSFQLTGIYGFGVMSFLGDHSLSQLQF